MHDHSKEYVYTKIEETGSLDMKRGRRWKPVSAAPVEEVVIA